MAKKNTPAPSKKAVPKSFDFEKSPYYVPAAFVIIFIALLILFNAFIFSDKMLSGSDTIQAGIFFRSILVDSVHDTGTIPQWNPYIFGGLPYIEAFHGDIFYPLSFLKYFGSIYRMLGMVLFWHIFIAGLFMFFCARQFKLSKTASLLSGICYMFASYLISLVAPGHDGKIFVTTLFPLTILFLDRGFNAEQFIKSFFNFSMVGLVIGFIVLSPHPQMSYFSLWAISFYAAFRIITGFIKNKNVVGALRPAALTAYAVIIGLTLSAIQFYPGYKYTSEFSPRADSKKGWEWATSWSLHEEEAFSQLIPEFAGVSTENRSSVYWGKNYFKDNSESVGVVTIFMALIGFFFYRRKESYFMGGLALFALIYALGATTPIFKLFFYLIPKVDSLRAPSMIMFLFSFSCALLAGMGLQFVIDRVRDLDSKQIKKFYYLLFGLPAFLLLIAVLFNANGKGMLGMWTSIFYSKAPTTMIQEGISKLDLAYMNLPSIQSGAWMSFIFCFLAALFIWLYRSRKAGMVILVALLLVPVVDGVRVNKKFIKAIDPANYWSPNVIVNYFKNNNDEHYRVMNFVSRIMAEDYLPHFGIEVVTGYHGNQLRWYDELLGGPALTNQTNPRFLNLVGAEYLIVPGNQGFPEGYFGAKPVKPAANFGQVQILKNENALPRFFLVDSYIKYDTSSQVVNEILTGQIDLAQTALLTDQPELVYTPDSLDSDSVWAISYGIEKIVLGTKVSQNKILILTDNYYDAWHATIDSQPAKVMQAYNTFRAVELPAGTKEVVFEYKSERYAFGKSLTYGTALYLLLVIGFYFARMKFMIKKETEE